MFNLSVETFNFAKKRKELNKTALKVSFKKNRLKRVAKTNIYSDSKVNEVLFKI
jgi:hypothetical protein